MDVINSNTRATVYFTKWGSIHMKHVYLNLKRFDIPDCMGGVNRISPVNTWGTYIVKNTQESLKRYNKDDVEFVMYFPEAHLINAKEAVCKGSPIEVGSQSLYWEDTSDGGNFGAYTSSRTANSIRSLGCEHTIIGHCEERKKLLALLDVAGAKDVSVINIILNLKVKAARAAGLKVLFCIGESEHEQNQWQEVLKKQLDDGLAGVKSGVVVAYEPIWSIGPGKEPAGKAHITKIAKYIKHVTGGLDVVYGGGLKQDNAGMLSSIDEINGGLIALTRFSGEIGFYPDEYLEIVKRYLDGAGIRLGESNEKII